MDFQTNRISGGDDKLFVSSPENPLARALE